MILYYSGTGNSQYVAEEISKITKDTVVDMTAKIKSKDNSKIELGPDDFGNLIISVPTYAWRIPRIVEKWIMSTEIIGVKKIWFLMTCGDSIGTAPSYNEKICAAKNAEYMGTSMIIMPENYIAMFKVPKDHTARKIIAAADTSIKQSAEIIKAGQKLPAAKYSPLDHIYSKLINPAFYRLFVKAKDFTTTDKCTGCGKCVRLCPMNNITLINNKPSWGSSCTHCMACICKCPFEAIEYGKKSLGKPRYNNPYVKSL